MHFTDCLGQTIPRLVVVLSATRAELATSGALSQSERNLMTALINRDPLAGDMGFVILADTCGIGEPESDVTEQQKAEAPFAVLESKSPVLASPTGDGRHERKQASTGGGKRRRNSNDDEMEKPYACESCDDRAARRSTLATHILVHKGIKNHHCTKCGAKFTTASGLKKHLRSTSKPENRWECEFCNHLYLWEKTRNKHRDYVCQQRRPLMQATSSSNPTWPEASPSGGGGGAPAPSYKLPIEIVEACAEGWGVTFEVAEEHLANGTEPGHESDLEEGETGKEG